jgi:uncharacterized iron-regulated protein
MRAMRNPTRPRPQAAPDLTRRRRLLGALGSVWLAGCTSLPSANSGEDTQPGQVPGRLRRLLPCPALLLGELHDAPSHPPLQTAVLQTLAADGILAALVLEMAERGTSTQDLPAIADEGDVRRALAWQDSAWPWSRYRQPVMAAIRAGAPVFGGNLPRDGMRAAMNDAALESRLPASALAALRARIREGHCHLLPEQHIPGMVRVQIARDLSMAQAVASAWQPGRTAVLLCGNAHARQDLGVPVHLNRLPPPWPASAGLVQSVLMGPMDESTASTSGNRWNTVHLPQVDHCAELRKQLPR